MLVLTRKAQEEILIGDSIRISIVRIKGNTVRLGIEAPRDVRVVRAELPPHEREGSGGDRQESLLGDESGDDDGSGAPVHQGLGSPPRFTRKPTRAVNGRAGNPNDGS